MVETRRLPLHRTYVDERLALKNMSRLLVTDGSLLFIVQIQYERHDTGNGAKGSKDSKKCRSHMYIASLEIISREGCIHASIPLSRS